MRFERTTELGQSLRRMAAHDRLERAIAYANREGLSAVFNRQITERNRNKILVFTHDDVRIDDYHLSAQIDTALKSFRSWA